MGKAGVNAQPRKAAYKGLAKNENRLYALFASANLYVLASRGRSLAAVW